MGGAYSGKTRLAVGVFAWGARGRPREHRAIVARAMCLVGLLVMPAACTPSEPVLSFAKSEGGVPVVEVSHLAPWSDLARARGALDFSCRPDRVDVRLIAEVRGRAQSIFRAEGCGRVARYACFAAQYDAWCVREPLDDVAQPKRRP